MSSLNPGGSRAPGKRLFSSAAIEQHCKPQIDKALRAGENSIADQPHSRSREEERNRRRRLKQETKRG